MKKTLRSFIHKTFITSVERSFKIKSFFALKASTMKNMQYSGLLFYQCFISLLEISIISSEISMSIIPVSL